MPSLRFMLGALTLIVACAPKQPEPEKPAPKPNIDPGRVGPSKIRVPPPAKSPEPPPPPEDTLQPMVPPEAAYTHGWMPLASTGVDKFLRQHPDQDGRGVIIGILDTGIDPGIPGLIKTSTDAPKVLDLRDFSDEGDIPLQQVTPIADSVDVAGHRLGGFGRVTALNTKGPYYAGVIREIPLGPLPASDLNGNGTDTDTLPVVVTRATNGWVLFADTDGDHSLAGERPVHDYLVARETFGWAARGRTPRLNIAANFSAAGAEPRLDLVFDISSHGSHVAGIAAGHDLYGVTGFDGVAPGAQLLGLKIANSAQGSVTTTGSMIRAIDYAIRFASARRAPLVLNLSFGVGNEIEGSARIDAMIDSVLAANPSLVFTISAGNDGPGLSTVGFPGSARRCISVGATLPSSFLPPDASGARRDDQLAYFSSRGGELAKPDLVTPGVAFSTVPKWSTGEEIEQGTSMAAPHAAGLAALLVSGLAQEKRPIRALDIKQALMVTARPLSGATFVDEGTGIPDLEQAYTWLQGKRSIPELTVRALGERGWATAALHERRPGESSWVQRFELLRPGPAPSATYTLRSDVPWAFAPPKVTLSGPKTTVDIRYDLSGLKTPGSYFATITARGADSLAGPVFRLVSTVIAPEPVSFGADELRSGVLVQPGNLLRSWFRADSARPFEVRLSGASLGQKGLAFLHEPDGMPYRDESTRPIGGGDREAVYQVDGRDVVSGAYEVVAVAPSGQALNVNLRVFQSPLQLRLGRSGTGAIATLTNSSPASLPTQVAMLLGGGERVETVVANGSAERRIPFVAPSWARAVVIDLTMDRTQWERFTDFGFTLFDSMGRQIEKKPLNYDFGRLQAKLPDKHDDMRLELGLFPGFAEPRGDEGWTARATIRLYAGSAVALQSSQPSDSTLTIPAGKTVTANFALPSSPWPLGDGFFPLAVLVARTNERSWTREGGLPPPNPPIMR
jgi:subtilisin family serine protease